MLRRTLATGWVTLAVAHLLCISGHAAAGIPLPEHPRPDFERTNWLNLNGVWRFRFDAEYVQATVKCSGACDIFRCPGELAAIDNRLPAIGALSDIHQQHETMQRRSPRETRIFEYRIVDRTGPVIGR